MTFLTCNLVVNALYFEGAKVVGLTDIYRPTIS